MFTIKKSTVYVSLALFTVSLLISSSLVQGKDSTEQPLNFTKKDVKVVSDQQASDQKSPAATEETASSKNQPQIFLATPEYDFGKVWEGKEVIHSFIVKNTGTGPLNIEDVRTG